MRLTLRTGPCLTALFLAAGLAAATSGPVAGEDQPQAKPSDVKAVDGKSLKKAIQDLKGKVVVVNFWATWCAPCVAEFPDLVKLQETYGEKGLVVVAASMDEPEDQGKVVTFVEAQKAKFPVYVRKGGSVDAFVDPLDRSWDGLIPTTYVFDATGKLVGKPLAGKRSYQQFVAAVEPLLKKESK